MANELADLEAEVSETNGVMQSAEVLIRGLSAAIGAAGTDKAKLTAIRQSLDSQSQALAAAVAENPLPGDSTPPTT